MNTRAVSQPLQALAISAIVLVTLLGGFILAVNDRNLNPIGLPNPIGTLVAVVSRTPIGTQASPPGSGTLPASTETITPTPTPTLTPTPVCAPPPIGWVQVLYNQTETTLFLLAQRYNTTYERLIEVNCLDKVPLQAMQLLYVPASVPAFVPTPVLYSCYPPFGWPIYIVQWGDTLSRLSVRYNVSIELLMRYNCLTSTLIYQGQRLYVPYVIPVATWTPWPTPTWTPLPSPTLTWIPTTPTLIWTPTETPIIPPTETPILPPTETPSVLPTFTPTVVVPTDTPPPPPTETPPPPATETPVPPPTSTPPVSPLNTPGLP